MVGAVGWSDGWPMSNSLALQKYLLKHAMLWHFLQVPHAISVVSDNTFILSIWSAASIAAARWALTISSERTVQASAERTKRNRQHNKAHVHYCNYVMIQRLMLNETFSLS